MYLLGTNSREGKGEEAGLGGRKSHTESRADVACGSRPVAAFG